MNEDHTHKNESEDTSQNTAADTQSTITQPPGVPSGYAQPQDDSTGGEERGPSRLTAAIVIVIAVMVMGAAAYYMLWF